MSKSSKAREALQAVRAALQVPARHHADAQRAMDRGYDEGAREALLKESGADEVAGQVLAALPTISAALDERDRLATELKDATVLCMDGTTVNAREVVRDMAKEGLDLRARVAELRAELDKRNG